MKLRRKLLVFVLALTMVVSLVACGEKTPVEQGQENKEAGEAKGEIGFFEEDDTTYISVEDIFQSLGGQVDQAQEEISIEKGEDQIKLDTKKESLSLNGQEIDLAAGDLKEKDGQVYLSKEALAKIIDARIVLGQEGLEVRTELPIEYAEGFRVEYLKNSIKKVSLLEDNRVLYLLPEGGELPQELSQEVVAEIPVKRVLIGSTIHGCDLRAIDEIPSMIATTSEEKTWEIEEVKKLMQDGDLVFVGQNKAPDYEQIFKLKPDMAFVTGGRAANLETVAKFDEIGIPTVTGTSYYEEHPLGRMEWMKLTACFYDKEEIVEEIFKDTVEKVAELEGKFAAMDKPKVVWMRISKGEVTVPLSESYAAKMIEIAGGDYIFADADLQEKKISLEELYDKGKDADVIIWEKMGPAPESVASIVADNPVLAEMKAVKEMNFYRTGDDYWQSIDKLDKMIESLAAIFHPEEFEGYEIEHFVEYKE